MCTEFLEIHSLGIIKIKDHVDDNQGDTVGTQKSFCKVQHCAMGTLLPVAWYGYNFSSKTLQTKYSKNTWNFIQSSKNSNTQKRSTEFLEGNSFDNLMICFEFNINGTQLRLTKPISNLSKLLPACHEIAAEKLYQRKLLLARLYYEEKKSYGIFFNQIGPFFFVAWLLS